MKDGSVPTSWDRQLRQSRDVADLMAPVFAGLDNPFEATRYHSLIVERDSVPAALEIVAWTPEGEGMGLKHREHETWGVQFHPESVLTPDGPALARNFLEGRL